MMKNARIPLSIDVAYLNEDETVVTWYFDEAKYERKDAGLLAAAVLEAVATKLWMEHSV
jgi:uncharacterized membrane protein (UPF0127 family)